MAPDEDVVTIGELGRILKEVRSDVKALKTTCAGRKLGCNTEYYKEFSAIKENVQTNKTNVDWLKRGFWYIAGIGSAALLLVIGVIASSALGG